MTFLDAASAATGISLSESDDSITPTTTSMTSNATTNTTSDWNNESQEWHGTGFYVMLSVFFALFAVPLCCLFYVRLRRSVQPVDVVTSSGTRSAAPAMTKEERDKRLAELQEQFAKKHVQKVRFRELLAGVWCTLNRVCDIANEERLSF